MDSGIDKTHPALFDESIQTKEERMSAMEAMKKRLIRNGLPPQIIYELGEKFKSQIKCVAEEIIEEAGK